MTPLPMVLHFVIVASWTGLWRPPHACGPENDPWSWHEMEVKSWWGLRSRNGLLILRIWKILKVSYVIYVQFGYSTLTHSLLKRCKYGVDTSNPAMLSFNGSSNAAFWEFPSLGSKFDLKSPAFCGLFFLEDPLEDPTNKKWFRSWPWLRFQSPIPKKMCCPSWMPWMPWMFCFWKLKSWSQEKVQQTSHNTWICLPFHCWPSWSVWRKAWVFGDLRNFRQETNIDMLVGYISCTSLSFTAFNSNCLVSRKKTRQWKEPQSQPRSKPNIS